MSEGWGSIKACSKADLTMLQSWLYIYWIPCINTTDYENIVQKFVSCIYLAVSCSNRNMRQDIWHVRCQNSNSAIRNLLLSSYRFCHQYSRLFISFILNSKQLIYYNYITNCFNRANNLPTGGVANLDLRVNHFIYLGFFKYITVKTLIS